MWKTILSTNNIKYFKDVEKQIIHNCGEKSYQHIFIFHRGRDGDRIGHTEIMTIQELIEKAAELQISLSETQVKQLEQYAQLLVEWNEKMNLTAITEHGEILEKHFYDSILPLGKGKIFGKVADVGTGAGFPGLVWKIVKPELDVSLIEPTGKRCTFLQEVINQLHLENIHVYNTRAEEQVKTDREMYDVVTARAVANLRVLSELCIPLVKVNGLFLAMKGVQGNAEAKEAEHATKVLGVELEETQDTSLYTGDMRVNLYYRKLSHTPQQYPRNYGQIKKKPL